MLRWDNISEADLIAAPENIGAWAAMYDSILRALETAERLLLFEVDSFAKQSGRDRIALASVRIKSLESFLGKVRLLAKDDRRRHEKFIESRRSTLTIFDLITDLCGVRFVFYFERDIRDAVLFWMTFPTYEPVEVTHYVQDLSGYDTANPAAARWIKDLPGVRKRTAKRAAAPKLSGYESLHFVIGFDVPLLRVRCDVANRRPPAKRRATTRRTAAGESTFHLGQILNDIKEQEDILQHLLFEVQCRTILEHTWGEVEHRARYSLVKAEGGSSGSATPEVRKFRDYKAILRAAQIFQNSLKAGFTRWDEEEAALAGRRSNVEIGPRDMYWENREKEIIRELNGAISQCVAGAHRSNAAANRAWRGGLVALEKAVGDLAPRSSRDDLLQLSADLPPDEYGRRRLLVMLLGFILAYAVRVPTKRVAGNQALHTAHEAAQRYVQRNVALRSRDWIPSTLVPVRLYEHMKLLDAWYSGERADTLFYDPLIHVRAASVYFRHFGALRRSTALLEEALGRVSRWKCRGASDGWILSKKYIGYRLAENYWASFNLEGHRREDLAAGLARARDTLSYRRPRSMQPSDALRIDQKLLAHILTMTVYQSVIDTGDRFAHGESAWSLLTVVADNTRDLQSLIDEKLLGRWEQIRSSSLRLQGFAIALACKARRESHRGMVDRVVVEARRAARAARRNMQEKLRSRRGGAMEFHVDVARELEQVVFSLCSDDWEADLQHEARRARAAGAGV